VEPARRQALLEGLDEIALTLKRAGDIAAFQARDRQQRPWVHEV
jgi:3-isopropylmalate/(R)-2-methylmalate dehydratase small subunit